ncbi:ABC transporter ATP-binding protein [Streptomyces cavernae]|uniref:ABC transporter ATP-binding protein n=1 Tax=Streptomyces cavernae TaxID=2259034 RepID=UPI000FEB60B7|nr:ABC transporter ATP-binding protein [Streptomyces cavernae]
MSPAALEITSIGKTFGGVTALDAVTLRVQAGTVHCVLGENGAGKTTLCDLVYGNYRPDTGSMTLYGEPYAPARPAEALAAGVAMVHQHFSLVPTMTVAENLMLGDGLRLRLPRRRLEARLAAIAESYDLRVEPDTVVADLPVGIRQQVEIIKCLVRDPRLLLLDEPTGVLAPAEIDALLTTCRRIAAAGKAVVLVTHKLGEVAAAGDAATVLRNGRVAGGGPLSKLPTRELVSLMVARSPATLDPLLAASLGLAPADLETTVPSIRLSPQDRRKKAALRLSGVTVVRGDGTTALDGVSLTVAPGEIVGIAGVEGNGQSELAAVLGGALPVAAGTIEVGGADLTQAPPRRRTEAGLGVIPEDRLLDGCLPGMTVADNLCLGRLSEFRRFGLLNRRAMDRAATAVLTDYAVRAAGPRAPLRSLSGGNQQRVVLARELALDPLVCLLAAQPTRGLDIGAVDAIVGRLRAAAAHGAGILVISSELSELLALSARVYVCYRGRLLGPVDSDSPTARDDLGRLMSGTDS